MGRIGQYIPLIRDSVERPAGIPEKWRHAGERGAMANHASTRTTDLYDRRRDTISLDEVERIQV